MSNLHEIKEMGASRFYGKSNTPLKAIEKKTFSGIFQINLIGNPILWMKSKKNSLRGGKDDSSKSLQQVEFTKQIEHKIL